MKTEKQNSNIIAWIMLFLIPMLIFPFMVTGIIRYFTGWDITKSLLPAFIITIPCLILFMKSAVYSFKFDWKNTIFLLAVWLPIAIIMIHILYNPIVNGFVGGGGDAGNHVFLQKSFLHSNPKEYSGFISLYAFTGWLEIIFKMNSFSSFRVSFYILIVFLSFILPFYWSVATDIAHIKRKKTYFFGFFVGLPITYLFLFYILCSLLHSNQAEGFLAHIFSLIVALFAWILYGFISSSMIRIFALGVCIVLHRFTYGLNLTDLLLCFAVALGLEGWDRANPKWLRFIYFVTIPPVLYAAWLALKNLLPVIVDLDGGITPPDLLFLIPTLALSSFVICFLSFQIFHTKPLSQKHTLWIRQALLPIVACVCACLLILGMVLTGHKIRYYAYKYVLMAQVLSICAITAFLPLIYAKYWNQKYLLLNMLQTDENLKNFKKWLNAVFGLKTLTCVIVILALISLLLWNFWMISFINLNIINITYTGVISGIIIFSICFIFSKKQTKIILSSLYFCICIFIGNFTAMRLQQSHYSDRMKKVPALWSMNRFYNRFYDSAAFHTIQNVLEKERASFGGYLHPAWPQINFMNALFGSSDGLKLLSTGEVNTSPKHCVFWSDKTSDLETYANNSDEIAHTIQTLTQTKTKQCKVYRMRWDIESREKLCWVCF